MTPAPGTSWVLDQEPHPPPDAEPPAGSVAVGLVAPLPIVVGPGPEHPPTTDERDAAATRLRAYGLFGPGEQTWDSYRKKTM